MLADQLKMPLLRLTTYASKSNHAVSHIKMTFDKDKNESQLEAELSTLVERSELSDIQSESISGLFGQLQDEIMLNFKDLPLKKIIFEANLNLLGLDNLSMKITAQFEPRPLHTGFFTLFLNRVHQYEINQHLEHAATNLEFHFKRGKLATVDLIFDNTVPNDNFYQIPFSDKVGKSFDSLVEEYNVYSMNIAPTLFLNFALTQRRKIQFLNGTVQTRAKLIREGNTFELNSVQDVLAQLNIGLNISKTAHISAITLTSHGRGYIPTFDLMTKTSDLDIVGTIDLNHEVAEAYQYIFKMILDNYSFPNFSKNWSQIIKTSLKMRNGKFVLNFGGYFLNKSFHETTFAQVKNILQAKASLFTNNAQIKEIDLTTKNDKVIRARMKIDRLDKHFGKAKGMNLTDFNLDDPQAVITRTFKLTDKGYIFEKERFAN